MPSYHWTGHAATGTALGEIDAASAGAAAELLQGRGITPLTIHPSADPGLGTAGRALDWPALAWDWTP